MKHAHSRIAEFDYRWPARPLEIVLANPEIPPNTGNVARLCAATGSRLNLVEPMGFRLDNAKLRRAGLDYWDALEVRVHGSWEECVAALGGWREGRWHLYSTGSGRRYDRAEYREGDVLVFGCETKGLPEELLAAHRESVLGIPMRTEFVRSLNLSTAVGIVTYHALGRLDAAAREAEGRAGAEEG